MALFYKRHFTVFLVEYDLSRESYEGLVAALYVQGKQYCFLQHAGSRVRDNGLVAA